MADDCPRKTNPVPSQIVSISNNAKDDFLFVNESGRSADYKVGSRPAIRSHVRKHIAKERKQKQKAARRTEAMGSSRQWQPLAPRTIVSQDLSLHDPNCLLSGTLPNAIPAIVDGDTSQATNHLLGGGLSTGKVKQGSAIPECERSP
jgi:hypothetical protein